MNATSLTANKKMLAMILSVAILATVGVSAASAQTSTTTTSQRPTIQGTINLEQTILSNVKIAFPDAANTAATAATGKVIGGSLTVVQGYVVYSFKVIDDKNMVYTVIVDPSSGAVLYKSQGHQFGMGGFGMGHGSMKHGMGGHTWNNAPSGSTTPSSSTAPSGSSS